LGCRGLVIRRTPGARRRSRQVPIGAQDPRGGATPTCPVLFVIPWQGSHWLIGTTDTPWDLDLSHPAASRRDISYLLEQVNRILVRPLTTDDIVGVYAGLRPLLAGESDATSKLSHEHAVVRRCRG